MSLCSFKSSQICECAGENTPLTSLSSELQSIILTEAGLLPSDITQKFQVCSEHFHRFLNQNKAGCKSKICGIPDIISSHNKDNKIYGGWYGVKADRNVSLEKVKEIHARTGIIVPVGTPICPRCRKTLYCGQSTSCSLAENFANKNCLMNSDNLGDTCSYQYEEQYNLRPHRLTSGYNFAVHAFTSSSQETTSYFETESCCNTNSQGTEASVIRIDRLGKFNEFLETCDISPVKCLTESLEKSSERTKRRYLSKATTCITALLNTICPDDSEFIKKSLFGEQENDKNKTTSSLLDAIVRSYMVANTSTLRRQLLSIATNDYSFAEVSASIPGLSHYKFYSAKKHAQNIGLGVPAQTSKIPCSKINDGQLDHFLDFITSNHLIKDLPIGEKTLQVSTGELIQTPNVIRSIAPATIIRQYTQLCEDENIQPLGTSTMYKILTDCSASVRQSMEGLDYYISEGSRAFTDLTETVEQLDLTLDEKKKTLDNLVVAKHYLKTDFKLHVNRSSSIADHCCSYALSEEKGPFCQKCDDHSHTDECQQCCFVDETLSFILKSAIERHWDNPEAVLFKVEKAIADIYEWKSHILRSKNQEKARQAVVNCLEENEAFMVVTGP